LNFISNAAARGLSDKGRQGVNETASIKTLALGRGIEIQVNENIECFGGRCFFFALARKVNASTAYRLELPTPDDPSFKHDR